MRDRNPEFGVDHSPWSNVDALNNGVEESLLLCNVSLGECLFEFAPDPLEVCPWCGDCTQPAYLRHELRAVVLESRPLLLEIGNASATSRRVNLPPLEGKEIAVQPFIELLNFGVEPHDLGSHRVPLRIRVGESNTDGFLEKLEMTVLIENERCDRVFESVGIQSFGFAGLGSEPTS